MAGRGQLFSFGLLPRVLAAQFIAFVLIIIAGMTISTFMVPPVQPPTWVIAVVQGALASSVSRTFGLRGGWQIAQFLLPLLAWTGLAFQLPPWLFLVAFAVLFLVYSNTSREQVPLYLTNRTTWAALAELIAKETPTISEGRRPCFVDLGSGLGGTLAYLSQARPDWDFVGVENAPLPYLVCKLRLLGRANATVRFQSLWDVDLSAFAAVYAFLSPAPMPRLLELVEGTLKPGALFISNSFWAPDQPYDGEAEVNDGRQTRLFFKRIG